MIVASLVGVLIAALLLGVLVWVIGVALLAWVASREACTFGVVVKAGLCLAAFAAAYTVVVTVVGATLAS
jgi:hypothetical protein